MFGLGFSDLPLSYSDVGSLVSHRPMPPGVTNTESYCPPTKHSTVSAIAAAQAVTSSPHFGVLGARVACRAA